MTEGFPTDFEKAFRYYDSLMGSAYIKADGTLNYSAIKRNLASRIDDKTAKEYLEGSLKRGEYSKRIIIAICILVKMHYKVINHILRETGKDIETSLLREDEVYFVLKDYYDQGLQVINDELINAGYKDLVLP